MAATTTATGSSAKPKASGAALALAALCLVGRSSDLAQTVRAAYFFGSISARAMA